MEKKLITGVYVQSSSTQDTTHTRPGPDRPISHVEIKKKTPDFLDTRYIDRLHSLWRGSQFTKGKRSDADGRKNEGMRLVLIDLCALGGTLLLETGVVGITLTDAGQVVAW
jgi:hypothetical protein